ncbi:MAG: hypothetical protein NTZ79_07925 [Proteobacteria bacterium]|nr:hypothetical protein [Pseudomonadota bacterium]
MPHGDIEADDAAVAPANEVDLLQPELIEYREHIVSHAAVPKWFNRP